VPGGLPTEALIAHVIVSKFADHLPLYRQAEIFHRQGVDIDRATLGNWVGRACFHLTVSKLGSATVRFARAQPPTASSASAPTPTPTANSIRRTLHTTLPKKARRRPGSNRTPFAQALRPAPPAP